MNKKAREYYEISNEDVSNTHVNFLFPSQEVFNQYKNLISHDGIGNIKTQLNNEHLSIHIGYLFRKKKKYVILLVINDEPLNKIRNAVENPNQIDKLFPDLIFNIKSLLDIIYGYSQILQMKMKENSNYQLVDDMNTSLKQLVSLLDKVYKIVLDYAQES